MPDITCNSVMQKYAFCYPEKTLKDRACAPNPDLCLTTYYE